MKNVKMALARVKCTGGRLNIVSEMFMFGIVIVTLMDSAVEIIKAIAQAFFNMILALNDKPIQVQESDSMIWITIICIIFLLIESFFCIFFVGKHMELKKN